MKKAKVFFPFLVLQLFAVVWAQAQSGLTPVRLQVEYLTEPKGLDVRKPRFSWVLESKNQSVFAAKQTAYRIVVGSSKQKRADNSGDIWDSGWVESDHMQLIEYNGKPLQSDKKYYWTVAVKDEKGNESSYGKWAQWSTGLFSQEEWTAKWIGTDQEYKPKEGPNKMKDPWFRKTFNLKVKPSKATLFVASVGYHEVYVNGRKIDDHVLAPAVTDHTKRARYVAYDIAPALTSGANVIVLWLGTSWSIFGPYATPDKPRTPLVIAQADIYGLNGQKLTRIVTDESWKTHPSPNMLTGNWGFPVGGYGGEIWDANEEIKGWNLATLNDSDWKNATLHTPALKLSAQQVETNSLFDEINPVAIESRPDGTYRVDMGMNFAGWTRITVKGNPGDSIRFLFSERLQDDMTFGMMNTYVIDASGKGTFENRFNYSSGRWITIKGLKSSPRKEDIKGWMARTAFDKAARFECSDPLQNWIYNTVKWTFENLSLGGFIVDCPQRERFGYGGDAHATSETGLTNFKLGAFYSKWLEDWRDVQGTEPMTGNMNDPEWARKQEGSGRILGRGILPQTAPTYHGGGGPAWGGIVVTLPWFMYQYQGDVRILEENFGLIRGWLEFLDTHVENDMLKRYGARWDFLGDWLWPGAKMNNDSDENLFFNNCYRVYNLRTAAQIAKVIGKTKESERWMRQAERSSKAIHARYYHPEDNNYSDKSMRSLAAALYGDIMPTGLRHKVMETLTKEILVNRNGHIDVGITGGAMLFKILRDEGRDDLIYSMTSQTAYPGWGFMKENGATTIWEMWEKDLPGHSLLHSSFLYPGAWYIDGLGGIKLNKPGYTQFVIEPPLAKATGVEWAKASLDSPVGLIRSYWDRRGGRLSLEITVPPNSTCLLVLDEKEAGVVTEKKGIVTRMDSKNNKVVYRLESGWYKF